MNKNKRFDMAIQTLSLLLPGKQKLGALILGTTCILGGITKADDIPLAFDSQWNFNLHTEYQGSRGTMVLAPDGKSMTLNFDFSQGGAFIAAGRPLEKTGTLTGIEVKAQGAGSLGMTLTDSTDQSFVFQLGIPGDAEKVLEVNLANPSNVYGGAKDKIIHYPLKRLSIMISKSKVPESQSGTVTINEILLKASK